MTITARPKARYKKIYRRAMGDREEIKALVVNPIDAATMLGVSRATIYSLLKDGKLPAYKLQSRTLILISDLRKFLKNLPTYEPRK